MLAIRMQRTGRKGHAMFRVVVQDSRLAPTSGRVVALLGSYDPHAKNADLNKDKVSFYLEHGAQPSDRAARLLQKEGVKLPTWVKLPADKKRTVRNIDKLRKNQPKDETQPEVADKSAVVEAPAEEEATKAAASEVKKEEA